MNIPGITDSNIELFATEYLKCNATYGGKKVDFWELPSKFINLIATLAFKDRLSMKTFKEEGIKDDLAIIEGYAYCNFGRFDTIPDIETKTGKVNREYHNCGRRGKCPFEFRRCKRVNTQTDSLTPRETDYAKFAAMGLSDTEIAKEMNLQYKSMISLAQRVRGKVGVKNRAGLASWAIRCML